MPIIPTIAVPRAPEPGNVSSYPLRFCMGQQEYVAGHPLHETFTVIGGTLIKGWPHYTLFHSDDVVLRVPQIHCASKPITYRKN